MTVLKYSLRNQTTTNHLSILESALHLFVTKSRCTTLYYIGFDRREPATGFDFISNVPSFRLARIDNTKSYSVLPVDCIMNGALMMPEPTPGRHLTRAIGHFFPLGNMSNINYIFNYNNRTTTFNASFSYIYVYL